MKNISARTKLIAQRGFSLLEVMVVITIIAVLVGMTTFSTTSDPIKEQVEEFARDFSVQFSVFQQEALYNNLDLGLGFLSEEYKLLQYTDLLNASVISSYQQKVANEEIESEELEKLRDNLWSVDYQGNLEIEYQLPEYIYLEIIVEDKVVLLEDFFDSESGLKPAIVISAAEEYTPFKINIRHKESDHFFIELTGDGLNSLLIKNNQLEAFE